MNVFISRSTRRMEQRMGGLCMHAIELIVSNRYAIILVFLFLYCCCTQQIITYCFTLQQNARLHQDSTDKPPANKDALFIFFSIIST